MARFRRGSAGRVRRKSVGRRRRPRNSKTAMGRPLRVGIRM